MSERRVPSDHPDFPSLVQALRLFAPLPDSEAEVLRGKIREERLDARAKMDPQTIGFVISGLMRAYYLDSSGKESTKAFWSENMLVYSLGATNASAHDHLEDWIVEAVEPTHLFTLSLAELDRLYEGPPCWNHVGRVFWQYAYREKLLRERQFLTLSATDRYHELIKLNPALNDRIPQYMIASYLGVTPVALSRLRGRRVKRRKPS